MYVKETYIPVRRRKRRKRFPVAMMAEDMNSSFYLFKALNADSIKNYKAKQKCNPKKKEKHKKLQSTVHFDAATVDLETVKENRKKSKKKETKRNDGVPVVKKYKFFQPEVKAFSDVTHSPNTTFDRLLHNSRKPLVDKNSVVDVNHQVKCFNSGLLSPSHCLLANKGDNRTSTPILISPVFPGVTDRNKQRNGQGLTSRQNLTPMLKNSIESFEKSSRQSYSFVSSDTTTSASPFLCNTVHIFGESKCRPEKIISSHMFEDSFSSPVAARTRSSIENEKINHKNTNAPESSENLSGIKMRLRRTAANENQRHNHTDSSFTPDESFFSSVKVQRRRNRKVEIQCNKAESAQNSGKSFSTILTRSKRTSEMDGICEKTVGTQDDMSAHISNERSEGDILCNETKGNDNSDESIPSSFRTTYHTNSNDQNQGRLSPLVRRSRSNESGRNCANFTWDSPKCTQLQFATVCQSPDMFASLDEIETDVVASKGVTVIENYSFSTCSSNDKETSSRNMSSGSAIRDYSDCGPCISPVEINGKSDVVRKSICNKVNLSSQVSNMLRSVHAGLSDSVISSVPSSDSDNMVNELCSSRFNSLAIEFDSGGSFRTTENEILLLDTPEVNHCSRSTQKRTTRSSSGAISVSSAAPHIETDIPSHSETHTAKLLSQSAHREESENLCSDLRRDADCHESDDCKGRSLTHSMSFYCEENSERLNSTCSRRTSLCRRLSHVVVPERRKRWSSNSNESLSVSDRRAALLSVSVIMEEEDDELVPEVETTLTQGVLSARDTILGRCNQSEPLTFENAFPERFFDNCEKIGEGLYGEVFSCQYKCGPRRVLKIIPIEGTILVNGEKQKKYNEVLSELVIAMELSNLRHDAQFKTSCFVEVARCVCVQGKYPQRLIDLWNAYDEEKVSENDSPTIFDDSQLFLIFELADGGKALETYCFTSAAQAFSAFVQLAFALAVAEITLEFEHRDLHWGNVLINKTLDKHTIFKLNGKEFVVPSNGIQVTIIDYTLSRMSYGGCCIFNDLAVDPELFISQGDYQFEVYRLMKTTVKNEWKHFRPYTNILWLHYILSKMLQGVHYKNISTKIHKKFKTKLTNCYNDILKYSSAYELVTTGNLLEMIK